MAINADSGGIRNNIQPADFQRAREARQTRLDAKVADLTQAPGRLSTEQIAQRQGHYNNALGGIDRLRGNDPGNKLNCVPPDWGRLFPGQTDRKIQDATRPDIRDNGTARDVKQDYANANSEANRERTGAARTAQKLGPGEHTMDNGDKVKVSTNPLTGQTTVTTTRPDGSSKTVNFDGKNPDQVDVTRRDQFGNEETISKDGTRITTTKDPNNPFGILGGNRDDKTSTTYDIGKNGEPVRTTEGPGKDNYERTTVNQDGSTDTKKLIYRDDNGQPVYQTTHEDGAFRPFPGWPPERPEPGRPFPGPRFPWDLDPFRPVFPRLDLDDIRPN